MHSNIFVLNGKVDTGELEAKARAFNDCIDYVMKTDCDPKLCLKNGTEFFNHYDIEVSGKHLKIKPKNVLNNILKYAKASLKKTLDEIERVDDPRIAISYLEGAFKQHGIEKIGLLFYNTDTEELYTLKSLCFSLMHQGNKEVELSVEQIMAYHF